MSSPGTSKTSTPTPPLSKDYHRVVSEMETNDLLRSTLTDDSQTQKDDQKTCLVLDKKPYPEHSGHSSEVVWELKERDSQTEQTVREVTKRSLESGASGVVIIVDNFCKRARTSNDRPFKIVRTRE
jgi:hypothetical protein